MFRKYHLFIALLFIFTMNVKAQVNQIGNPKLNSQTPVNVRNPNVPFPGEQCASSYLDDYLKRTDPIYRQNRIQIENHTQQIIQQAKLSRLGGVSRGVVYTIPVVFHVMHSGESIGDSTNISDAQILSAIDALNRDFRRTAADGGIANSGPLGIDAEIEFCIAQRDPSGNATSGITRHDMSGNQPYLDSGVYHTPSLWRSDLGVKTMVNWDQTKYMNVWIVNKIKNLKNIYSTGYGGGVQGYAYFPGATYPLDGIVIVSSAVGNDPTGAIGYNLWFPTRNGRTLSHEVGHYLNLYHTFNSSSICGPSGASCGTTGDRCCDTPPTNVGSGNNCTSPACALENKENYMQYQNSACASDFTPDQVARMRAILGSGGIRNALVNTNNCIAPPATNDLKLDTILYPLDTICDSVFSAIVVVCNLGSDTVKSFRINYNLDFGTVQTYNWTGSLPMSNCDTVTLLVHGTTGTHTLAVSIFDSINGISLDSDLSNNNDTTIYFSNESYSTISKNITECGSYTTTSGKTYTTSGTYYDTISNIGGCDTICTLNLIINNSSFGNSTTFEWAGSMGGTGTDGGESVTTDIYGNVYSVGFFVGTVDFDPSASTSNLTSAGSSDIFISKIDANGNFVWAKRIGGVGFDRGHDITTDVFGNILITGLFSVTVDFDPSAATSNLTSLGSGEIFVLKMDVNGNFIWAKQLGGNSSDNGYSVTTDSYGNVYTTGHFQGTGDFDPSASTYNLISAGSLEVFISKLDVNGNFVWAKKIGGSSSDNGYSVATDVNDNVYLLGEFQGTVDFDPSASTYNLTSAGDRDIFISKMDATGNFMWAKKVGGINRDVGYSLTVDNIGNVLITGDFIGTVDFNPGVATYNLTSIGINRSVFVLKLDGSGSFVWAKITVEGNISSYGRSITTDKLNNVYTTGAFSGTADFNPDVAVFNLTSIGSQNVFISKLDANGDFIWAKKMGGSVINFGVFVHTDAFGNIYTTGSFNGTGDYNQDAGVFNLTSAGNNDIFIHKMSQSIIIVDTICGSFISPSGKTWTVTGIYQDTLTSVSGCDSIVEMNLTIYQPVIVNQIPVIACDSAFVNSIWYFTSTIVNDTVVGGASNGCDSISVTNITINNYVTTIISITACDSSQVNGTWYYTSKTVRDTLSTASSCDSILVTNLTINNSVTTTLTSVTACDSSQINGTWYFTSQTVRDTLATTSSCDSILVTNLTINQSTSYVINSIVCDSLISASGKIWKITGIYYDTISNTIGCDSLLTYNLIIDVFTIVNLMDTACDSLFLNGSMVYTSGIYNDTLATSTGCDDIISTNLIINNSTSSITTITVCDSLVAGSGKVYYISGVYYDTTFSATGCDSTITYYLTVNYSSHQNIVTTACDSFISPSGKTWTITGNYIDTLYTSTGCDSLFSIYVVIDTTRFSTLDTTLCSGDTMILGNGTIATTTGTYYDTIFGTGGTSVLYSEDFNGVTHSFTLNTNDTNAISPSAVDNAWIVNNNYVGGTVLSVPISNTPNQNSAITGNVNSKYLHIHSRYAALFSFPSIVNCNFIDGNISAIAGQSGLNFSKMTSDISTIGENSVFFEMYYLCKGSFGRVYYSINSGVTWNRVGGNFNNGGAGWTIANIIDPAFANQATLRFAVGFNNTDGFGTEPGFAVDNIKISGIRSSGSNCDSIVTINVIVLPIIDTNLYDTICGNQIYTLPNGGTVNTTGIYRDTITSSVGCDSIVIVNLEVNNISISTQNLKACDSLISPTGKVWKTSGTYIDTLVNSIGCDSLITLNVTINNSTTSTQNVTVCDSLISPNGKIWKVAGIYFDTINNSNGCDSLMTFNLVINSYISDSTAQTVCDSIIWRGTTYNTTGVYSDTLFLGGCDTVFVLSLTINSSTTVTISETYCDSYTSPTGKVWTTTGIYMDTIPNSVLCDSIITFNITIDTTVKSTILVSACDSYTLPNSTIVTMPGTYIDTLSTSQGCDSIITINLLLNYSTNVTNTTTICVGDSVVVGSNIYTAPGTYKDTLLTVFGCDSIIVTILSVDSKIIGTIGTFNDLCEDASSIFLTASPFGGTWSGTGVNVGTGEFDPTVAGVGTHTIYYTPAGVCGEADFIDIIVFPTPIINFAVKDEECDQSDGAIDINVTSGSPVYTYLWSNGSIIEDLLEIKKGTYTVNVTDINGCKATETITLVNITNDDCQYVAYVANIFSPDGNGENDVLYVQGSGIETLVFKVFNRWGNLVFESTTVSYGWNGEYKGVPANPGAFVYFVEGTFLDGKTFDEKGTVTLVR